MLPEILLRCRLPDQSAQLSHILPHPFPVFQNHQMLLFCLLLSLRDFLLRLKTCGIFLLLYDMAAHTPAAVLSPPDPLDNLLPEDMDMTRLQILPARFSSFLHSVCDMVALHIDPDTAKPFDPFPALPFSNSPCRFLSLPPTPAPTLPCYKNHR